MMSHTHTAIITSVSPRPYAGIQDASLSRSLVSVSVLVSASSTVTVQDSPAGHDWMCGDHMSTEQNPVTVNTFGSKRFDPGSFAGVLT
jgi:hypothetical protein